MDGGRHGYAIPLVALTVLWGCSRGAPADGEPSGSPASGAPADTVSGAGAPQTDTLPLPIPEHPLEGTEWVLVSLPGAPAPPPGAHATLVLDRDGSLLRGSTGCNDFDGSWEIAGTRLTLGVTGITGRSCPGALSRLQTDYIEALRRAGSFRLRGDVLELLGEAGVVARFEPRSIVRGESWS